MARYLLARPRQPRFTEPTGRSLDMRKLDVAADDQAPQAAVGEEEVKSMAA
jgi:hypothetical protein